MNQQFTPFNQDAPRPHRHRVGQQWSIDEMYICIARRLSYAFRAVDEEGQVRDVYVSPTRDTVAATAFLTRAVESTEVAPTLATIDEAAIYPPALAVVLSEVMHIRGRWCNSVSSVTISISKGRRVRCVDSRPSRAPRSFVPRTGSCVICVTDSTTFGVPAGDVCRLRSPRLAHAWNELTLTLAAA